MDDIVIARVLHILAIVHWIGGVALVTTRILPAVARLSDLPRWIELFEAVEGNFSLQAKSQQRAPLQALLHRRRRRTGRLHR